MVYKFDLEKADDHVHSDFLEHCLVDFGFPSITVRLIMHYVTSSSLSLICNGKWFSPFSPTRGLLQGDPLYPYLVVICMERLSHFILEAVNANLWQPVKILHGPGITHLFFADDVLLFSKTSSKQAQLMVDILLDLLLNWASKSVSQSLGRYFLLICAVLRWTRLFL